MNMKNKNSPQQKDPKTGVINGETKTTYQATSLYHTTIIRQNKPDSQPTHGYTDADGLNCVKLKNKSLNEC